MEQDQRSSRRGAYAFGFLALAVLMISFQNCGQFTKGQRDDSVEASSNDAPQNNNDIPIQDIILPNSQASLYATNGGITPVGYSLAVKYTIQPTTSTGAWNAASNPIEVYMGQTLTIENKDTVSHRFDGGGKPCPSVTIMPNQTATCVINQSANSVNTYGDSIYDGLNGTQAKIFIISYDGAALYNYHCKGCHGALSAPQYSKISPTQIRTAVNNIGQMRVTNLMELTDRQREAISKALGY